MLKGECLFLNYKYQTPLKSNEQNFSTHCIIMSKKEVFCVLVLLGVSGVLSQVTEDAIENITNQTAILKPLVKGTNASFGQLMDDIDATVARIDTTTSNM